MPPRPIEMAQARQVAEGEGAQAEQAQLDHRRADPVLDGDERRQQDQAAGDQGVDQRVRSSPWCARRRAAGRR